MLFAANDIGWRIEHYTKFINAHYSEELCADSFVNYIAPSELYMTNYTYSFDYSRMSSFKRWGISLFLFVKFLFKYDIFHFFSGETILTRKTRKFEFLFYRLFNKKIIMHFVGADIRNTDYVQWKEQNMEGYLQGTHRSFEPLSWQSELMDDSVKFACKVLVSTPDLLKIYPGYALYYPVLLDLEKFEKEISNIKVDPTNEIVIMHAPSNPIVKGSRMIEPVLRRIKNDYGDNVKLILREDLHGVTRYSASRYDLFKAFMKSDIVIDQMVIGWYGLQAIEAIMTQNQVVSYIEKGLESYLFPGSPIISANALDLYSVIEACIQRHLNGQVDFNKAKRWVKKYHSIENNNKNLVDAWLNRDRSHVH